MEVAGFRHEAELDALELNEGDAVQFVPEPHNPVDCGAIRVESAERKLGYVPKGHLDMLHRMLDRGLSWKAKCFASMAAPRRPLVYVLTRIRLDHRPAMPANSRRLQAWESALP